MAETPTNQHAEETGVSDARLLLRILEGYAYLGLIIAIPAAATAFLIWGIATHRPFVAIIGILVGVPLARTTARTIRTLFFIVPEPAGVLTDPKAHHRLIADVEAIRRQVRAPRVHRILITASYEASAVQHQRLRVFGTRNTLILGYPLLAVLPVAHVRAVIAHELVHIARAHGTLSKRVYRARASWIRLMEDLTRHQAVPAYAHGLFKFYLPRLRADAASVSRRQELLADRLSAAVTTPEVTAQALVATEAGEYVLDRTFWPRIFDRVERESDLPRPYAELQPGIWAELGDPAAVLDRLLTVHTSPTDTHPALRDRLAALGQAAHLPEPAKSSAADEYFGSLKQELAFAFDREWRVANETEWRAAHERIRHRRERLAQLAALPAPDVEQLFERAGLEEEDGHEDAALGLFRDAHDRGHARAGIAAGRILLRREDEAGVALIESAMSKDATLGDEGCNAVLDFLDSRGRAREAFRFRALRARHQTSTQLAADERSRLSVVDQFTPCTDASVNVSELVRCLGGEPSIVRVFLVMKQLRYSPGGQTVVAVSAKDDDLAAFWGRLRKDRVVPAHATIIALGRDDREIERALERVPGARIYASPS